MTQLAIPGLKVENYHDFTQKLAYANQHSKIEKLETFYRSCFPGVSKIAKVKDLVMQRQGIDTIVTFQNGKEIYFDEKIRSKIWNDILLEEYSIWPFSAWGQLDEYKAKGALLLDPRRNGYSPILIGNKEPVPENYAGFLTAGWISGEKLTDYITYVIKPSRSVYFLPFLLLQRAWANHHTQWLGLYGRRWASNRTYITTSVPVPVTILYEALFEAAKY